MKMAREPLVEVRLWGSTIGAASRAEEDPFVTFEYDAAFARSGMEVSPLVMPLSGRLYRFPELSQRTFQGLPGMLADSLPDKFGSVLINAWLARQGRSPESFSALERLCYTGTRGMGALEFHPMKGPRATATAKLDVEKLVILASEILSRRNSFSTRFSPSAENKAMADILRIGTSAGGARAKAVIAWNPATNEIRSGQVPNEPGFGQWLIKFDGVESNRDKESNDPKGYGVVEYAYHLMALEAGLAMSECRLMEENGRRHFLTRRFDRTPEGGKLHMQSLCALAHFDFNMAGAYAYEQVFQIIRRLGLGMEAVEQMFRRMTFNIVARNQDDHVKNIAFLMDRTGRWALAPAFDITYSYNPDGNWTSTHQMTMNGKRDTFTLEDFRDCARSAGLKQGQGESILRDTVAVVSRWKQFSEKAGVDGKMAEGIQPALRLEFGRK
jgi:serine/threonine-protein kinase HipA